MQIALVLFSLESHGYRCRHLFLKLQILLSVVTTGRANFTYHDPFSLQTAFLQLRHLVFVVFWPFVVQADAQPLQHLSTQLWTRAVDGPHSVDVVVVGPGRLHNPDHAKPTTVASTNHTPRSCSRTRGAKDRPEWDPNFAVTRRSFCRLGYVGCQTRRCVVSLLALVCPFSIALRHRTVLSISVTGLAFGMGHPHTSHASRGTHAHPLPFDSFPFSIHAVSFHTMHLDPLGMCNSLPVFLFSFLVTFQHELFALREADGRKVTLIVWVRRVWGNAGAQRRAVGTRWGAYQAHLRRLDREVYLGGGGDHVKMNAGVHADESEGKKPESECGGRDHARAAWEDRDRGHVL